MKITHLEITNFLGISHLVADVPDAGAVVTGGNAQGKTAVLKAIAAALSAQGVGPEAIRIGADKAEILVDLDELLKVRRAITKAGDSLTVTTAEGDRWAKPQTRLTTMLGSTLDPLSFYLAKPAERRAQILAACPVVVTAEDLRLWTGEDLDVPAGKHGIDVVDEVRKRFYDERRRVNAEAKVASQKVEEARAHADAIAKPEHEGLVLNEDEQILVRVAVAALEDLRRRQADAAAMEQRTQGTRAKVAKLLADAVALEQGAPMGTDQETMDRLTAEWKAAGEKVSALRDKLRDAELAHRLASERVNDAVSANERHEKPIKKAEVLRSQAGDLEVTLAETAIVAPMAEELTAAEQALERAHAHARLIEEARAAHVAMANAALVGDAADDIRAEAERLDRIVTTLSTTAPVELAARSNAIPGLAFVDGTIALDGRALDNLSGAEQLRFAVDLAKRMSKAKILVVDGLERLDAEQFEAFVKYATADGWQVIGTRVTGGELRIEAIEPSRVTVVEDLD